MANSLTFTIAGEASGSSLSTWESLANGYWLKIQVHGSDLAGFTGANSNMLLTVHNGAGSEPSKIGIFAEDNGAGTLTINFRLNLDAIGVPLTQASLDTGDWYIFYFGMPVGNQYHAAVHHRDGTDLGEGTLGYDPGGAATGAGSAQINIAGNPRSIAFQAYAGEVGGLAIYAGTPPGPNSTESWSEPSIDDADIIAFAAFEEGSGTTTDDEVATSYTYSLSGSTWNTSRANAWGLAPAGDLLGKTSAQLQLSSSADALKITDGTRGIKITGSGDVVLLGDVTFEVTNSGVTYTFPNTSSELIGINTTQSWSNKSGSFLEIQIPSTGSVPTFVPTQQTGSVTLVYNSGSEYLYAYSNGAWVSSSFV